jgi:D-alanine-D-alanine ligase
LIRLETPNCFYDFEAKYSANTTKYLCPCGLSAEQETYYGQLCLSAFDAIGATGWGRVDFMFDAEGQPRLLEVNTVPGMTDHSLVPMAAAARGMNFNELVARILRTSLKQAAVGA